MVGTGEHLFTKVGTYQMVRKTLVHIYTVTCIGYKILILI